MGFKASCDEIPLKLWQYLTVCSILVQMNWDSKIYMTIPPLIMTTSLQFHAVQFFFMSFEVPINKLNWSFDHPDVTTLQKITKFTIRLSKGSIQNNNFPCTSLCTKEPRCLHPDCLGKSSRNCLESKFYICIYFEWVVTPKRSYKINNIKLTTNKWETVHWHNTKSGARQW